MRLVCFGKTAAAALLLTGMCVFGAHAQGGLNADEIIRRAMVHAQQELAETRLPDYSYTKIALAEEYDSAGKLREHKEKVYQILSHGGMVKAKLVEVNGRPPSPADLKKQAENESSAQKLLGGSKPGNADRQVSFLAPEVVERYHFKLVGSGLINGRSAYKVAIEPKHPSPPMHRLVDRMLDRLSGTIWVDTQEFEVAHAELHLDSQVDLLGGIVGSLKKMAYSVTRTRVADGLWLNTFSTGDFEGRKLFDPLRIKTRSQTVHFRPVAIEANRRQPLG